MNVHHDVCVYLRDVVWVCVRVLNIISTLPSPADVFTSPDPMFSTAPPSKPDTGAIMNLFGGG